MVTGGDTTPVQGLDAPEEHSNFADAYYDLLDKVDVGLVIIEETEDSLSNYEGGSHSGVLAFTKENQTFHVSNSGSFEDKFSLGTDLTELTTTQIDELATDLEDHFLPLAGGTMDGPIDMDGNDIQNAGTVDAGTVEPDELILPTR